MTTKIVDITGGEDHTCALSVNGGMKCWGFNGGGQLGDGSIRDRHTPVDVRGGLSSGVIVITAGGTHTCAVTSSGAAKCWGENQYGQVGDGTIMNIRKIPVSVLGLSTEVKTITAGGLHTCAITTAGIAKCWGRNYHGNLGDGTTIQRLTPVNVEWLLSPPVLVSPANGAVTNDNTPTFSWKSVPSGYKYQIQISSNSKFTALEQNKILSPGLLSWTTATLSPGKHYWRVRAISSIGEKGYWSAIRTLIVE